MKPIQYLLLFVLTALLAVTLSAKPGLAQEEIACESDVMVQDGDWLSTIAERAYGDPALYEAIAFATNLKAETDSSYATINSHDQIEPGWKLCIPGQQTAESLEFIAPVDPNMLTVEQLINATYSGIYEEPVTLTEGRYEGEPFVEGSASRPIVEVINRSEQYGDLDGDGVEDAVVFLTESSGGTGNFVYVAAKLNQNGSPVDAGALLLEDRVQVKSVAIENGRINLEITTEGPGDAACCKSHKTGKSYVVQNGQLTDVSSPEENLERISVADLDGITWTLLELSQGQPALPETEVTLTFAGDQLSGSGGCNNYSGGFTLGQDNPFALTVGPLISTQMACPDPIMNQETTYLTGLQNAAQWGYIVGNLAIYYPQEDGSYARLLFAPPAAEAAAETGQVDMLLASTWQWVSFTDPVQSFDVAQPALYTLDFLADGELRMAVSKLGWLPHETLFNLTGGTKMMAFGAYHLAHEQKSDLVYLEEWDNRPDVVNRYHFQHGVAKLSEQHTVPPVITIADYLNIHLPGFDITGFSSDKQRRLTPGGMFEKIIHDALAGEVDEVLAGVRPKGQRRGRSN